MSDIRTRKILAKLLEDLNLAILKAKVQLEYVEEFDETDDSDRELEHNGLRLWE